MGMLAATVHVNAKDSSAPDTLLSVMKICAGLELPPETNPADWILDMTLQRPNLPDGRSLADAYEQQTPEV